MKTEKIEPMGTISTILLAIILLSLMALVVAPIQLELIEEYEEVCNEAYPEGWHDVCLGMGRQRCEAGEGDKWLCN